MCKVNIIIKLLKYLDGQFFYDISYTYKYEGDKNKAIKLRPFMDDVDSKGEIIKQNEMTDGMIKFLLFTNEELSKEINTYENINNYRINIMKSISLFWD